MEIKALRFFVEPYTPVCGQSEKGIIIGTINVAYNHLTSSSVYRIVSLINCLETKKLILSNNDIDYALLDTAFLNVCLTGNLLTSTHIEKITGRVSSFYFINNDFHQQKVLQQIYASNYNCNLYFWNANLLVDSLITLLLSLSIEINLVSVYDEYLQNDKGMIDTASKLQKLNNIVSNVEYILQSENWIFAYGMNVAKITEVLKTRLLFYDRDVSSDSLHRGWKCLDLYNCAVYDKGFQELVSCLRHNPCLHLEMLNISNCRLTEQSVKGMHELLKSCIIKNLVISENFISNKLLQCAIVSDICTESEILNFKHGIPLTIFNNHQNYSVEKMSEQFYSINKYFINCDVDDSLTADSIIEEISISYEIFLSNIGSIEKIGKILLLLCEYSCISINVFQANLSDSISIEIAGVLQKYFEAHHSYLLTSDSMIIGLSLLLRQNKSKLQKA